MADLAYWEVYHMNQIEARKHLVETYQKTGSISATSRLELSVRWVYIYNVLRPHTGVGMDGKSPLAVLKGLGYNGDEAIALFPPIILDRISADLILSCDKEVGNDLLAHYS